MSFTSTRTEPFSRSAEEVLRELRVDVETGLSATDARDRLKRHGPNSLRQAKKASVWAILAAQFKSLIVVFLLAGVGISVFTGDDLEALAIGAVILINGLIGFVSELQAVRSMEALRQLGHVPATVRRDGVVRQISAALLVPGDIVLLEGGDVVAADLRLVEASKLQADEAALTGESVPVDKTVEPVDADTPLADRTNMIHKGTAVTRGAGAGVVVATGMTTELGKISALVEQTVDTGQTPLEKRLDRLGQNLIWLTLGVTAVVAMTGVGAGTDAVLVLKTAIALAVAAIPEGLPIVATLALARGMHRMARRNALVNRLAAVETLGATNVICTDKTGTLTEGQMTVRRIVTNEGELRVTGDAFATDGELRRDGHVLDVQREPALRQLLEVAVLCNDATWAHDEGERGAIGDPVEVALLVAGGKAGVERKALLEQSPELREVAFDPEVKMMATYHGKPTDVRVAVKGAPEAILSACSAVHTSRGVEKFTEEQRAAWAQRNEALAASGLRILAFAEKRVSDLAEEPFENLTFLGFAGLVDPPRSDVRGAIAQCLDAGIRVVMLTGDQAPTARFVSCEVGLLTESDSAVLHGRELRPLEEMSEQRQRDVLRAATFARVTPRQKLDLVRLYQRHGCVVAMTGDGVNDAPALKQANIGIAMGTRGTQVAREAADMILCDDAFSTIVAAVGQGRAIFDNIRTFIRYLISCNVSEVLVVFLATVAGAPLPILPLQILFLNLVTDVFPALALGLGEGSPLLMRERPRDPREPFLTRRHWLGIGGHGVVIAASVLGALATAVLLLRVPAGEAVTVSFLTLAMAQLWHVFNMRAAGSEVLRNAITRNPYVWGALVLCMGLLLGAVYLPGLSAVLETRDPGTRGWLLAITMSMIPLAVGQAALRIRRRAR